MKYRLLAGGMTGKSGEFYTAGAEVEADDIVDAEGKLANGLLAEIEGEAKVKAKTKAEKDAEAKAKAEAEAKAKAEAEAKAKAEADAANKPK
jgi:membrane protein involved in colicin uptake